MLPHLAETITSNLVYYNIVKSEDRDLYEYGVKLSFDMLLNLATVLVIGLLMSRPFESIAFMIVFIPLRIFSGGAHASGRMTCYLLSCGTVIVMNLLLHLNISIGVMADKMFQFTIASAAIIVLLAPVQSANKPLDKKERQVYAWRARCILAVELGAFALLFQADYYLWAFIITYNFMIISGSMVLGYYMDEGN